jgi:hypothetical protein
MGLKRLGWDGKLMIDETDPRTTWLRSLGWRETMDGRWTGQVIAAKGRYRPMSVDRAFEVALKRSVTDKQFVVEIVNARVRLALPWRDVPTRGSALTTLDALARSRDEQPDVSR